MTPIIELKQVSFYYPEGVTPALTHIDLAVPAGGFVLVCGPSGSGKSQKHRVCRTESGQSDRDRHGLA